MPAVNAVTVNGDAAPVSVLVAPPFDDVHVAVKLVIVLPLLAPGVNVTLIDERDVCNPCVSRTSLVVIQAFASLDR